MQTVNLSYAKSVLRLREPDSYKGNYGHAFMLCGSYGMCGAAILSARACLHSGAGMVTICSDESNRVILQTSVPEAMYMDTPPESRERYSVIGCGCGLGKSEKSYDNLLKCISYGLPMVIDADAINLIAQHKELLEKIPKHSIFTPHIGEFERLCGQCAGNEERSLKAAEFSKKYGFYLVLKGHNTKTFTPSGKIYSNSSGNAGMATAGSGDVLCGIITALSAQKYDMETAAVLGVYLHGLAGDLAAKDLSQEYLTAGNIIDYLSKAFLTIINDV